MKLTIRHANCIHMIMFLIRKLVYGVYTILGFLTTTIELPLIFSLGLSVSVCLCLSLSVIPFFFSLSQLQQKCTSRNYNTKSTYLNVNLGLVDKIIVQSICSFHHSCSLSLHSNRMNLYESILLEWVTHINT